MYTREQIRANRLAWALGLQEPERRKLIGHLEDGTDPNTRCCIGHGCQILGITRSEAPSNKPDGIPTIFYENNTTVAPESFMLMVGMHTDCGTGISFLCGADVEEDEHNHITSLVGLNDRTNSSTQDIGVMMMQWIEGGDGTPFKPLSDYPEETETKIEEPEVLEEQPKD